MAIDRKKVELALAKITLDALLKCNKRAEPTRKFLEKRGIVKPLRNGSHHNP